MCAVGKPPLFFGLNNPEIDEVPLTTLVHVLSGSTREILDRQHIYSSGLFWLLLMPNTVGANVLGVRDRARTEMGVTRDRASEWP